MKIPVYERTDIDEQSTIEDAGVERNAGGLNRILFNAAAALTGGSTCNGSANLGPASLCDAYMETIVHEMGMGGWGGRTPLPNWYGSLYLTVSSSSLPLYHPVGRYVMSHGNPRLGLVSGPAAYPCR